MSGRGRLTFSLQMTEGRGLGTWRRQARVGVWERGISPFFLQMMAGWGFPSTLHVRVASSPRSTAAWPGSPVNLGPSKIQISAIERKIQILTKQTKIQFHFITENKILNPFSKMFSFKSCCTSDDREFFKALLLP